MSDLPFSALIVEKEIFNSTLPSNLGSEESRLFIADGSQLHRLIGNMYPIKSIIFDALSKRKFLLQIHFFLF